VGYQVSTAVFEGPFDLLLHLVTKDQVDIWELSLSSIVDEYVATIEGMQALDLSEGEEELALWEERDLLLARLLECKTFKDASLALSRLMDSADLSVPRRAGLEERFLGLAPDLLEGVTPGRLHDALARLLAPKPVPKVNTDHVAPIRASVAETLEQLVARLPREGRTTFRRLIEGLVEPLEIIVCFLALLELCKRGAVDLEQAERLGELRVNWLGLAGDDEVLVLAPAAWDEAPVPVPVLAGADMSAVDEYEG
jgi:segregation and condensation protein A